MHSDPNLALAGGRKPVVERIVGGLLPRSFTFRIPFRNVFRARRRSAYTILGMAFALILTVATASSFDSIDYLLDRAFGFLERWDVMAAFEQPFGGDRSAEVRTWAGVRDVQAARFVPAEITFRGGEHEGAITAMSPEATFHGWETLEGDPAPEVLARNELVVAIALANKLGLEVGDSVSIKTPYRDKRTSVRVGAVTDEMLGAPAFISLDEARVIVGTSSNEYNVLYLNVDPRLAQQVKDELFDLRGASTVMVKEDMLRSLLELMEFADFYQTILFAFGFAMAFVVIYNTFTANVVERTREIATMRTIGESNSRLAVMVTIENLLLAVIGLPLGIWLGVQAAQALYSSFSTEAYTLTAVIHTSSVVWLSLSMIGVLLVSEIPPIRRIFKLDLAEATKVME